MSDGWRVTREDSTDLGFALWCLTCSAIEHARVTRSFPDIALPALLATGRDGG